MSFIETRLVQADPAYHTDNELTNDQFAALAYAKLDEMHDQPETELAMPSQSGQNRTNHGTFSWWDDGSWKDCNSCNGRRRHKGPKRAPKWQQFAGGRRQAQQSIRHDSVAADRCDIEHFLDYHEPL